MDKKTKQILSDPILPLLLKMSAPNTVAFLINAFVVLAEFWFIGQLGITPLAAITLAFPAIMLTQQMAFGALGGAVSSSISRALGANDKNRALFLSLAPNALEIEDDTAPPSAPNAIC